MTVGPSGYYFALNGDIVKADSTFAFLWAVRLNDTYPW